MRLSIQPRNRLTIPIEQTAGWRMAVALLLATLHILNGLAIPADKPPSAAVRLSVTETPEYQALRLKGFDRLYNMDYPAARECFRQMTRLQPEHPAAYFYLATENWLWLLNQARRLQTNLYSGSSFYGDRKEKIDPKTDAAFRQLAGAAVQKAEAALKKQPGDPDARYYLGAAHGLLAGYEGTVARAFISALRHGLKAVELHQQVLEQDPGYADAYITVGSYNYVMGSLPFFFKLLAALGGHHGSREEGLRQLRLVAERGRYAKDDGRVALLTFLARERNWKEMLPQLEQLASRYPQNFIFRMEHAQVLLRLGKSIEAGRLIETLLADPAAAGQADLIHFSYGETLLETGQAQTALAHFQAAGHLPAAAADLTVLSRLRAGQALDLLGRRAEALAEYRQVLARQDVYDSKELAEKYLKKPYQRE